MTAESLHGRTRRSQDRRRRGAPLLARLFLTNAVVLAIATMLLAATPATVSRPLVLTEAVVLVAGLTAMLLINLWLTRRTVAPLERLTELMRRVDPLRPGARVGAGGGVREAEELARAFNDMLARLEDERRESARRVLGAQEDERLRIARDLHDGVGQYLTALLLQTEVLRAQVGDEARETAGRLQATAEESLDEVRRIARNLRPEALDELGLRGALSGLARRLDKAGTARIEARIGSGLPALPRDAEFAIYRVAQEALTNAARHSGARRVTLTLDLDGRRVVLEVTDDGHGLQGAPAGNGLRGMGERAIAVGGRLSVDERPAGGVSVRLEVPANGGTASAAGGDGGVAPPDG